MAPRRSSRRLWLTIGVIVAVVLVALAGGGLIANASLSSTYSPQRAVSDYFAAMGKGDVSGMMSNATFLTGDSSGSEFFGRSGLVAMMGNAANKQISAVRVGTVTSVDDSTSSVDVSLSWGGTSRNLTYKVRKDPSRVHYVFYDSWRVEVPFTTITISAPNQAGILDVDGISLGSGSSHSVEVIQGIHQVTMPDSSFYDLNTQAADGVGGNATVTFPTTMSDRARAAAADAVRGAFGNVTCDASKYFDCPNHRYTVPAGYYDTLPFPGGDIRANSWWSLVFTGDPTANMKLTVTTDFGKVTATGTCAMTLTVDGNRTYHFTGDWTGTLNYANGGFGSDILENCDANRA